MARVLLDGEHSKEWYQDDYANPDWPTKRPREHFPIDASLMASGIDEHYRICLDVEAEIKEILPVSRRGSGPCARTDVCSLLIDCSHDAA